MCLPESQENGSMMGKKKECRKGTSTGAQDVIQFPENQISGSEG